MRVTVLVDAYNLYYAGRKLCGVDHIEYGNYISKVIKRPLATEDKQHKPVIVRPNWPSPASVLGATGGARCRQLTCFVTNCPIL
jgi:hypothetical protein